MLTSAETKCLRESMGLTTKWLADRWHVAEYSVKRRETNRILPDEFETDLRGLKTRFDKAVQAAADTPADACIIVPRTDRGNGEYPAAWHRAIAQQAAARCHCRILYTRDGQL